MGRLIQQSPPARIHRRNPARQGRSLLLCPIRGRRHGGMTQTQPAFGNPGAVQFRQTEPPHPMPFVVAFAILVLLLPPMVPSAMAQPVDVSSGDRVETLLRVFPNGLTPEQADAVLGVLGEA